MNAFVKRQLTVLGALFLLVYVGYQGYQVLYSPIRTETVYSQSMYETVDTRGFTVRNETPITGSASGYLFYSCLLYTSTPCISASEGRAVPIERAAYTCIESAEITSPSSSRARRTASADLPEAVGPATARTGMRG